MADDAINSELLGAGVDHLEAEPLVQRGTAQPAIDGRPMAAQEAEAADADQQSCQDTREIGDVARRPELLVVAVIDVEEADLLQVVPRLTRQHDRRDGGGDHHEAVAQTQPRCRRVDEAVEPGGDGVQHQQREGRADQHVETDTPPLTVQPRVDHRLVLLDVRDHPWVEGRVAGGVDRPERKHRPEDDGDEQRYDAADLGILFLHGWDPSVSALTTRCA